MLTKALIDPKHHQEHNSGVGVFFSQQDAGLLPAGSNSGNYPTFYCLPHTTSTFPKTNTVFCLSRRQ
jgi:hypothetical protein